MAHVKVPAKLVELAGPLTRETPRHNVVGVAVGQEVVAVLVVAVVQLLRGHPLLVLQLLLPVARSAVFVVADVLVDGVLIRREVAVYRHRQATLKCAKAF